MAPMGGGLMNLIAYTAQDRYLMGNPEITFFKTQYKRTRNPLSLQKYAQKNLTKKDTFYILDHCQEQFPELCQNHNNKQKEAHKHVLYTINSLSSQDKWKRIAQSNKKANKQARLRQKRLERRRFKHNSAAFQ